MAVLRTIALAILPALIALFNFATVVNADCFLIDTAHGVVDLKEGEYACAPANYNNSVSEAGQYYVRCLSGTAFYWRCPGLLKWDMGDQHCDWPQSASCEIPEEKPEEELEEQITCNSTNCVAPDCFCYGDVPKMNKSDIPQFIMLTFDDAVTSSMFSRIYLNLLIRSPSFNPNFCPIQSTFFIAHNYTDYRLVKHLYNAGHELASHSINHTSTESEFDDVTDEIVGQRNMISELTGIPAEEIQGFRSPFLDLYGKGGDVQFEVLAHHNMTWDSSITNVEIYAGRSPLWPFTMDFPIAKERCPMGECPLKGHPGVWEVPMNGWMGSNGFPCGMIDACSIKGENFTGSHIDYYNFFKANFDIFYKEKVPMHMFTHASMFLKSPNALKGLKKFMREVLTEHEDVWFVTPSQVISWMKDPVTNEQMLIGDDRFDCGYHNHF